MDEYREDLLLLYNQLLPHENLKDNDEVTEILDKIKRQEGYNIILGLVDNVVVSTCTLIILPNITHQQKPYAIIENVEVESDLATEQEGIKKKIKEKCENELPDYEIPSYIECIEKIPYKNTKHDFKQLEAMGEEYVKQIMG